MKKEIRLSQAWLLYGAEYEQWEQELKTLLSGRPITEVIEGELMVYLKKEQ